MKTLTKRQRHSVYKKVLKEFLLDKNSIERQGENFPYICLYLDDICNDFIVYQKPTIYFPEFFSFKPKNRSFGGCWWTSKNIKRREEVLRQCIEMTKPTKKA